MTDNNRIICTHCNSAFKFKHDHKPIPIKLYCRNCNKTFLTSKPSPETKKKSTGLYAVDKPDDISEVLDIVKVNASKIHKSLSNSIMVSKEDLEGYGYLGLLDAYNSYSKEKYPKFTVYASFKVRSAIIDYLRTLNYTPSKYFKMLEKQVNQKIASGTDIEYDDLGNIKTIKNIIKDGSDITSDLNYNDYLKLQHSNSKQFISLEDNAEFLSNKTETPHEHTILKETVAKILKLSGNILDSKEKYIIEEQFFNDASATKIAEDLKISTSRVSQIRTTALNKLKNVCDTHGVTYV